MYLYWIIQITIDTLIVVGHLVSNYYGYDVSCY